MPLLQRILTLLTLLLMILVSGYALAIYLTPQSSITPFASDGCSAFPDGTLEQNALWLKCCEAHDLAYWRGGTYQERQIADEALKQCVASVGQPEIAVIMLAGVRVGGTPLLPTTFRWGYGWRYPRFYGNLTRYDEALIADQLSHHGISTTP